MSRPTADNEDNENEDGDTPLDVHETTISESDKAIGEDCEANVTGLSSNPEQREQDPALVVEALYCREMDHGIRITQGVNLSIPKGKM